MWEGGLRSQERLEAAEFMLFFKYVDGSVFRGARLKSQGSDAIGYSDSVSLSANQAAGSMQHPRSLSALQRLTVPTRQRFA
jgi:hypothetical protein